MPKPIIEHDLAAVEKAVVNWVAALNAEKIAFFRHGCEGEIKHRTSYAPDRKELEVFLHSNEPLRSDRRTIQRIKELAREHFENQNIWLTLQSIRRGVQTLNTRDSAAHELGNREFQWIFNIAVKITPELELK